jgi:hypothetical protein
MRKCSISTKLMFLSSIGRREAENFRWNIILGVTVIPAFIAAIL